MSERAECQAESERKILFPQVEGVGVGVGREVLRERRSVPSTGDCTRLKVSHADFPPCKYYQPSNSAYDNDSESSSPPPLPPQNSTPRNSLTRVKSTHEHQHGQKKHFSSRSLPTRHPPTPTPTPKYPYPRDGVSHSKPVPSSPLQEEMLLSQTFPSLKGELVLPDFPSQ